MVQPIRIRDFTRRQVRERERLFNPEDLPTEIPENPRSNWDYFMAVLTGFFLTLGTAVILIFGYVLYLTVTFP